ncbi:Glu/Leu/Phe/Val dehydrogenase [Sphingorhabdus arenilitoris]|uniref:Glu/Leu/Phe/Val dehydrogenase n=1 Tax=Sphingorhabdus arenilitoris TaxID=1490041 RepID=A0ABV8RG39_9SPHN
MTAIWDLPDFDAHESVHMFDDPDSGLRAVIAVHSTHLGPAAGGTRFWHYADSGAAITDALRLSRGMSYKNAMAGLPLGGGKGVVLAPAHRRKTPEMLHAFGRAIESLGGRYVTAEDVGMSDADMVEISAETRHVAGLPVADSAAAGGDPGPFTARGVYLGIKAAARYRLGANTMAGIHVAVQGIGSVGGGVARLLAADGAKLTIADIDAAKAQALADETGAQLADLNTIMTLKADIFSPNALGAVLNRDSIDALNVSIVAGGANNQMATAGDAQRLFDRGIIYAPDYVINAGGIINVGLEYLGNATAQDVHDRIDIIPQRLTAIWDESKADKLPAAIVADRMAQRLIGRG